MDETSSRQAKVKRLTEDVRQKTLASNVPTRRIPQMSETAFKRWNEARDTYLGGRCPEVPKLQRVKPKIIRKPAPVILLESHLLIKTELQPPLFEQPLLEEIETIHEPVDVKCVETETDESILIDTEIEQIDEAIQADLPSLPSESQSEVDLNTIEKEQKEEIQSNRESVECDDKATETDLVVPIEKEDGVDRQSPKETTIESIPNIEDTIESIPNTENTIESIPNTENTIELIPNIEDTIESIPNTEKTAELIPNIENTIEPANDAETKTILSSSKSELSVHEQLRRLRHRFKRASKERRLLTCLLALYLIIMFGLLIVIFLLLWTYQERSLVINGDVQIISTEIIDGVARYGESCNHDNDCKRPFTCFKKRSAASGHCRCPIRYDFLNNQCIGDLNALCTKDTDCQRYMLCSGMYDGTRRCHCQPLYIYDNDRRQCRGDYEAPCQSHTDCRANLICNQTINPSLCSCQANYRYNPLVQKCRGDPGAVCEQATAECTDNAECRDGACECAFQFIPNEKKICVDPCPKVALNRVKIRYPGNCRRFIDCRRRTKNECPEMTIFNFRTQLCDYRKNVIDCL